MSHIAGDVPPPPGLRRAGSALAATLLALGAGHSLAAPAHAASGVPASQPLVVLLSDHVVRAAPSVSARRIETVRGRRPLTRVRTVLPVLAYAISSGGRSWAHVRLPGRPNGHEGWILTDRTRRTSTDWKISISLAARQVTIYHGGLVERRFRAVVGARSTPTPRGRFFVEEAVALSSRASGGPFALAASARSNVLQQFAGGPGQIAIHGTNHLSDPLGTAASHGCIRLGTRAITWLAGRIGAGTPLTIKR
jgi:hypothetical protein